MNATWLRVGRVLPTAGIVLAGVTALPGCGSSPTDPGGEGAPELIAQLPRLLSAGEQGLISANNRFAFPLLAELLDADPGKNLFFSPLSAHMALGMAMNGAQGTTLAAMRDALGFGGAPGGQPPSIEEMNAAYSALLQLLEGLDPAVEIEVANSVWHRPTFPFRQAYLDRVRTAFDAVVQALDFDDPSAPTTINNWVSGKTNGRITRMLDSIDPAEVMFLLNAIYFKGDWRVKFDRDLTRDAPFHLEGGGSRTVKMMVRERAELLTANHGTFQLVDLPYGGAAFRMTILLPASGVTLSSALDGLDAERWSALVSGLATADVPVEMPRFRLEWEKQLKDVLVALGMGVAFMPGAADFGLMLEEGFDPQQPGTDLHITRVKQKTFVEVNEEGTEAAGATSVGVGVTSVPTPVVVDRPFLFAIRERLSGTLLFVGAVYDPPSS